MPRAWLRRGAARVRLRRGCGFPNAAVFSDGVFIVISERLRQAISVIRDGGSVVQPPRRSHSPRIKSERPFVRLGPQLAHYSRELAHCSREVGRVDFGIKAKNRQPLALVLPQDESLLPPFKKESVNLRWRWFPTWTKVPRRSPTSRGPTVRLKKKKGLNSGIYAKSERPSLIWPQDEKFPRRPAQAEVSRSLVPSAIPTRGPCRPLQSPPGDPAAWRHTLPQRTLNLLHNDTLPLSTATLYLPHNHTQPQQPQRIRKKAAGSLRRPEPTGRRQSAHGHGPVAAAMQGAFVRLLAARCDLELSL